MTARGDVVVCLHGFPDIARSWRFQVPALTAAGYEVVTPTMLGYEPASTARVDHPVLRMAEHVVTMLDAFRGKRVHLVGHDWGAMTSYLVAALAPEKLASLTALAIAHPRRLNRDMLRVLPSQAWKSAYIAFFQLRGFADWWLSRRDFAYVDRLWRLWSPSYVLPAEEMRAIKDALAAPGVKRAVLAYYRAQVNPLSRASREIDRLLREPLRVPTLAITGAQDGCMDTRLHDRLMQERDFAAGLEVARVEGAGHFLHMEKPNEVNAHILAFLRSR